MVETPHLDNVAIKGIKGKTLKHLFVGSCLGAGIFNTLWIFSIVNADIAHKNGDYDLRNVAYGNVNTSLVFVLICCILIYIAECKKDKNAKKRKQLVEAMISRFQSEADKRGIKFWPDNDEYRNMAVEYFLGYMTATERQNLKNRFNKLNPADKESEYEFCEYLLSLVSKVVAREPGLLKVVADAAAGKTYMYPNWNYGRGGR